MRGRSPAQQGHAADLALVEAVLRGEREAQRGLVMRILPHLRAVARAMLGPGADAEDAAQNATLKVLERASSYRGDARLESWARRVATRICIDHMRARKRRREVSADAPGNEAILERADSTSHAPGWERLPRPLHDYLDRLPEGQREAVVLRHVLEYSVAEIASMLELPHDTAKSRLLYGRRALRKMIRQDFQAAELKRATQGAAQ